VSGWVAGAIGLALGLSGSVTPAEPTTAALAAMAAVTSPSVAAPLPGSTPVDGDLYQVSVDCSEAITRYLAPDAPVPPGATRRQVGQTVLVDLPYARSGISFQQGAGYCQYRIANAPTVRVAGGLAVLPAEDHFSEVLCSEESDTTELIVLTELTAGRAPAVLVIMVGGAIVRPGTVADVFAGGEPPDLPIGVEVVAPGPERFEFQLTDGGATARVTGSCTGSVYRYLGATTGP
jgi:hypothetical protein